MHEMTVSYRNADGLFRFDEAIRGIMNRWPGEETDSGQDLETHMRHISVPDLPDISAMMSTAAILSLQTENNVCDSER